MIFHPVRQALVNLNQRIREKQSTPYGLNRLPETHALTHEIYQTSPNQQERQKNDLLYVCRKSNAQIYGFFIYTLRIDIFSADCFLSLRFGLGAFQVLGIIMLEYRSANLFVDNHIKDYADNGADDFYDDNVIKEYE